MYRTWTFCFALLAIAGCDTGADAPASSGGERTERVAGTYRVEQRCNGLGAAAVDFTPRGQGGNYHLLVRGGDDDPRYAAVDRLELAPSWNDDNSAIKTTADGLLEYRWTARLTKDAGWLDNADGNLELPAETAVAFDPAENRFFLEKGCGDQPHAPRHAYRHVDDRLVLHDLNLAMAEARDRMLRDGNQRYIDQRRDYQGGSGAEGVSEGHHDRNQHLLNVAALMKADAEDQVPGLARLVTEHRPGTPTPGNVTNRNCRRTCAPPRGLTRAGTSTRRTSVWTGSTEPIQRARPRFARAWRTCGTPTFVWQESERRGA